MCLSESFSVQKFLQSKSFPVEKFFSLKKNSVENVFVDNLSRSACPSLVLRLCKATRSRFRLAAVGGVLCLRKYNLAKVLSFALCGKICGKFWCSSLGETFGVTYHAALSVPEWSLVPHVLEFGDLVARVL